MLIWLFVSASIVFFLIALCNVTIWPRVRQTAKQYSRIVSVLIPARNEENNLATCLEAIVQQGNVVSEILIYNDHSTDNTAQIIREYSDIYAVVKELPALPLSPGWYGKNFACAQLAQAARGNWLLFIDADTRLTPNAINCMINEAQMRDITFLSCWPKFTMISMAEKTLMPMLNFAVFSLFPTPLLFLKRPEFTRNPRLGLAHGACMLFEKESYHQFGGHEQVKDQIFEDTRLAQLWRKSGRIGLCLDGQEIVNLRMYANFSEIWFGFQKNFYPAFRRKKNYWLYLALHIVVFLGALFLVIGYKTPLSVLPIFIVTLTRLILVIRFKQPLWSVLFHPLAELVLITLGLSSWLKCKTGQGVIWKGREYFKTS